MAVLFELGQDCSIWATLPSTTGLMDSLFWTKLKFQKEKWVLDVWKCCYIFFQILCWLCLLLVLLVRNIKRRKQTLQQNNLLDDNKHVAFYTVWHLWNHFVAEIIKWIRLNLSNNIKQSTKVMFCCCIRCWISSIIFHERKSDM